MKAQIAVLTVMLFSGTAYPSELPQHLQFSAMYPQSGAVPNSNYKDWRKIANELQDWGNGLIVRYDPKDPPVLYQKKLLWARAHHKQVAVEVDAVFFLDSYRLRADYRHQWKKFVRRTKDFEDVLYAFKPGDEPYWIGTMNQGIPREVIKETFEYIGDIVLQAFPETHMIIVHGYPEIDADFQPFSNYDLVGFDCYGDFEKCGKPIADLAPNVVPRSIPEWIATLESRLLSHQRVVLVPDGFLFKGQETSAEARAAVVERAKKFVEFAAQDPNIVGFIPFFYLSSTTELESLVGTRDIPELFNFYEELFQ